MRSIASPFGPWYIHWVNGLNELGRQGTYELYTEGPDGKLEAGHSTGAPLAALLHRGGKGFLAVVPYAGVAATQLVPFDDVRVLWNIQVAATATATTQDVARTTEAPPNATVAPPPSSTVVATPPVGTSLTYPAPVFNNIFCPGGVVGTDGSHVTKGNGDQSGVGSNSSPSAAHASSASPLPSGRSASAPNAEWQVQGGKKGGGRGFDRANKRKLRGGGGNPKPPQQQQQRPPPSRGGRSGSPQQQQQRPPRGGGRNAAPQQAAAATGTPLTDLQARQLRAMNAGHAGPFTRRAIKDYLRGRGKLELLASHGNDVDMARLEFIKLPSSAGLPVPRGKAIFAVLKRAKASTLADAPKDPKTKAKAPATANAAAEATKAVPKPVAPPPRPRVVASDRMDPRIALRIGVGESLVDASGDNCLCLIQALSASKSGGFEDPVAVEELRLACVKALQKLLSSLKSWKIPGGIPPMFGKVTPDQIEAELSLLQRKQGPLTSVTGVALCLLFPGLRIVTVSSVCGDNANSAAQSDSVDGYVVGDLHLCTNVTHTVTLVHLPHGLGHYQTITKVLSQPKKYNMAGDSELDVRITGWKYIYESQDAATLMTHTLPEMLEKQAHVLSMTDKDKKAVFSALAIADVVMEDARSPKGPATPQQKAATQESSSAGELSSSAGSSDGTSNPLSTTQETAPQGEGSSEDAAGDSQGTATNASGSGSAIPPPATPIGGNGLGHPSPASSTHGSEGGANEDDLVRGHDGNPLLMLDNTPLRMSQVSQASAAFFRKGAVTRSMSQLTQEGTA